jgi:hypothetical protein
MPCLAQQQSTSVLMRDANSILETVLATAEPQWFQRLTDCQLVDPVQNHETAEGLDRDWLRASKDAANQVKKKPHCPFSHKLSATQKKKNDLQCIVSQATLQVGFDNSIAHTCWHGYDFLIPPTLLECQIELKQAQTEMRQTEKDTVNYRRKEQQQRIADLLADGKPGGANRIQHQVKAEEIKAMYTIRSEVSKALASKV